MTRYASNKPRGVESSSKKTSRKQDLENELISSTAAHNDELGSNNGSVMKEDGSQEKRARVKNARQFFISQGKRQRKPNDLLNWYAASAYRPEKVKSHWQRALDSEHDRYEVPDVYSDYSKNNPTTNQYGLVETALKNYSKSKNRLSSSLTVGV